MSGSVKRYVWAVLGVLAVGAGLLMSPGTVAHAASNVPKPFSASRLAATQLHGSHADAAWATRLTARLGHVPLTTMMKGSTHHRVPICDHSVLPPGVDKGFCWDSQDERSSWYPQGISSTADAAADRDWGGHRYLVVSAHEGAKNTRARVTFVNWDAEHPGTAYHHVLLVRPTHANGRLTGCKPISGVHAGGLAWYGTKLFVQAHNGIAVFDLADLAKASKAKGCDAGYYPYVLPKMAQYSPTSRNITKLSFLSLDREPTGTPTLMTGEYTASTDAHGKQTAIVRYPLDASDQLPREGAGHLVTATQGYVTGVARMQGVLAHGKSFYLSTTNAKSHGTLYVWDSNPAHSMNSYRWAIGGQNITYWGGYLLGLTEYWKRRTVFEIPISAYCGIC